MLTTGKVARLVPRLFDELGPLWHRKPVREQYRDVIAGDRDMRGLVGDIPSFLLREQRAGQMVDKPWLDMARRSLAITAAEKVSDCSLDIRSVCLTPPWTDHPDPSSVPLPFVSDTTLPTYPVHVRQCSHDHHSGVCQCLRCRRHIVLGILRLLCHRINRLVSSSPVSRPRRLGSK